MRLFGRLKAPLRGWCGAAPCANANIALSVALKAIALNATVLVQAEPKKLKVIVSTPVEVQLCDVARLNPVHAATLTEALLTATNAASEPPPERLLQEATVLRPLSVHIDWVVRRLAQQNDGYITAPCQEACLNDLFRRAPPEPHASAAPPPNPSQTPTSRALEKPQLPHPRRGNCAANTRCWGRPFGAWIPLTPLTRPLAVSAFSRYRLLAYASAGACALLSGASVLP